MSPYCLLSKYFIGSLCMCSNIRTLIFLRTLLLTSTSSLLKMRLTTIDTTYRQAMNNMALSSGAKSGSTVPTMGLM